MFQIPDKNKKWISVNKGDLYGNLAATFNMDFDTNLGKVRVSPRLQINTDDTDDADLGLPWAFIRTKAGVSATDQWWAGCGAVLFKTAETDPTAAFAQDAIATGDGTPTDLNASYSDMVEFNGALIVSTSTDLHRLASASWDKSWWDTTLAQAALTSAIPHPLHVSVKTNLLCVGDGNLMHTITTTPTVSASRVILPAEFEIIWIRSSYDGTWIGARNKFNREAKIFFWDESAENYNRGYGVKSDRTLACVIKDGLPYTVNGEGQLLKFTGSGFEEVAVFPTYGQMMGRLLVGAVHRNGMAIIEGKIHISISSEIFGLSSALDSSYGESLKNFPSGIWVFDEIQGLRHKYSFSMYDGTENDYGCWSMNSVGALVPTDTTTSQGLFLAGGLIRTTSSAIMNAIFYKDTFNSINKRGHFITSIFESSAFEDIFKDLLVSFKRLKNSGDKIIIKYRTLKSTTHPIEARGTWTSTTTFTATVATSYMGSVANLAVGNEVMILIGKGAGSTAKISEIAFATPTYTITLAEAIPGVTAGTMNFLASDWIEAAVISTQSIERQGFDLDVPGTWIQLKVEMRSNAGGTIGNGVSPELEKILINNTGEEVI